tara:strand:- start:323 stop:652 length:330 start_codon:yes stop_codon:yes gene_type:complete
MQLYTESQKKQLNKNWEIENRTGNMQKAVIKLFNPSGIGTWYITSMTEDETIAYGVCSIQEVEIGSIDMTQLKRIKIPPLNLPIERDIHFEANKYTPEKCIEMEKKYGT